MLTGGDVMRVLDPTAERSGIQTDAAQRLASLDGRTIAILDNGKINVDGFCDALDDILRSRYGVASVVRKRKPNASAPVPQVTLTELVACDAVISAVGD
jgi:hypothetical protein